MNVFHAWILGLTIGGMIGYAVGRYVEWSKTH